MKSKTSCFNRMIFWKNVTRFWPAWSIYAAIVFFSGPVMLLMMCQSKTKFYSETENELSIQYQILQGVTGINFTLFLVAFMAIIVACLVFGFLNKSTSAYMIHSLPVTRKELFVTNYVSGFLFIIVPQILSFLASVLIAIACGITKLQYFGIWILLAIGVSFIAYNMSVFCVFLTGQTYVIPLAYLVLNYGYFIFYYMPHSLIVNIGYGIEDSADLLSWTMPLEFLQNKLYYSFSYDELGMNITGMEIHGVKYVPIYMLASLVLLVLACVMYQKRKMETAGEFIAIRFLRPVFRWVAGLIGGYFFSNIIYMIFSVFIVEMPEFVMYALVLAMSLISFMFAEMLIQKRFRIFNSKKIKEVACFVLFVIASLVVLVIGVKRLENYIPKMDEVESVSVLLNQPIEYSGEDVEKVIRLQESIIANKEKYKYADYTENTINIRYCMKDGSKMSRSYWIPSDTGEEMLLTVEGWEIEPQNVVNMHFGYGLQKIISVDQISFFRIQDDTNLNLDNLTQEQRILIVEALLTDAREGNLGEYNTNYVREEETTQTTLGMIDFVMKAEYSEEINNMYDRYYAKGANYYYSSTYEEMTEQVICLEIGPKCVNTINVLESLNIVVQN